MAVIKAHPTFGDWRQSIVVDEEWDSLSLAVAIPLKDAIGLYAMANHVGGDPLNSPRGAGDRFRLAVAMALMKAGYNSQELYDAFIIDKFQVSGSIHFDKKDS